jgi:RHS repeat-associated protein
VVTDQSGKVVWRWDNADPFGEALPDDDPDADGTRFTLNLRFPGQYFDKETGLHYNYFRDYEPGTGRYVESDPIGLAGGANTYLYVSASPLVHADPRGLDRTPAKGKPNSWAHFPSADGGSTDRYYGPDGKAVKDIDRGHDHGAGDPHVHDWDWSNPKPRAPGRPPRPGEVDEPDAGNADQTGADNATNTKAACDRNCKQMRAASTNTFGMLIFSIFVFCLSQ